MIRSFPILTEVASRRQIPPAWRLAGCDECRLLNGPELVAPYGCATTPALAILCSVRSHPGPRHLEGSLSALHTPRAASTSPVIAPLALVDTSFWTAFMGFARLP